MREKVRDIAEEFRYEVLMQLKMFSADLLAVELLVGC